MNKRKGKKRSTDAPCTLAFQGSTRDRETPKQRRVMEKERWAVFFSREKPVEPRGVSSALGPGAHVCPSARERLFSSFL